MAIHADPGRRPRLYRWGAWAPRPAEVRRVSIADLAPRVRWAHRIAGSLVIGTRIIFDYELKLIRRGAAMLEIEGRRHLLGPGSLILTPPFAAHAIIPIGDPEAGLHDSIHFDPIAGHPPPDDEPGRRQPYRIEPIGHRWPEPIATGGRGPLADAVARIVAAFQRDGIGRLEANAECGLLLARLLAGSPSAPSRLAPVLDRMERAIDRPYDIAELAALIGVSPVRLRALFRAELGRSPLAELRARRMRLARTLLPGHALDEVVRRCGYADRDHFSRDYRRHHGVPPSRDRH